MGAKQLNNLTDQGKNTCGFSNMGLVPKGRFQSMEPSSEFCHASIISKTHILISDSRCWDRKYQNSQYKRLSCHGARQLYELSPETNSRKLSSGQTLVKLPQPLPYTPHELAQNQSQRQEWLLERAEFCKVETPNKTLPLSKIKVHKTKSSEIKLSNESDRIFFKNGGHIICESKAGKKLLVGQVGREGKLWPKINQPWPDYFLHDNTSNSYQELEKLEKLRLLCQQNANCLEKIGSQTIQATNQFIPILEELRKSFKNIELQQAQGQLKKDFQDLLSQCQDVVWELNRSQDDTVDSGWLWSSEVVGSFEALSLNIVEAFSDDFLVEQFRENKLISQQLTYEEVREIAERVASQSDRKDMGTIQRISQTALELSRQVVIDMLLEMNPSLSKLELSQIWTELSTDFQACLDKAKNSSMIEVCSNKFSVTVPTLIAKIELERQIQLNFKQRNSKQHFIELKKQSELAFKNCLQSYYYPEKSNEFTGHSDRIRACVYEGIIAGYNFTAKAQIENSLLEFTDDPQIIKTVQENAFKEAQTCDYGVLFHQQDQKSSKEYETLARLSTVDFQNTLENCSADLTKAAGKQVVRETILSTKEVVENFDKKQREELSEKVLVEYYDPCMESQEVPDPKACESMIKDLTTLKVAAPMMFRAIDEQINPLKTDSSQSEKIKNQVARSLNQCHDQLKQQHLKSLAGEASVTNKQALNCLEQGIMIIAKASSEHLISHSINKNPQTKNFANQILSTPQIQELPDLTAECFSSKIQELERVDELAASLSDLSKDCALQTQKTATLYSLAPIIDEKLTINIPKVKEREKFIEEILYGKTALSAQIDAAKNQDQLDAILVTVPAQVALRFARKSAPGLVDNYLAGMATKEKRKQLATLIIDNLENCLEQNGEKQENLDFCINQTTALGHLLIIEEVVSFNTIKNLEGDQQIITQLVQDSQKRLKSCLDLIPQNLDSDNFNKQLKPCITDEIGLISRDIPREAILSVSTLMKSNYDEEELREQMQKIESFYLFEGGIEDVDERDPALMSYMVLNTCITSARSRIKQTRAGIDEAQHMYEDCTSKIKDTIAGAVKRSFIGGNYEGQKGSHYQALDTAGDILLSLTGKSPPSPSSQESSNKDANSDILKLLELVGQNTVVACNYDPRDCQRDLEITQQEIQQYKKENPEATSKDLQTMFINSTFMKLVIEANIAKSMREELSLALSDFQDSEGLLQQQIKKITSPETMNQVMSNRYGQAVTEFVTNAIQEGEMETVVKDPRTRSALGLALTENTQDNSFTDQLLFGLVQPELKKQRESSSGIRGIFKNTKITFGRLFGVVEGRDFDWQRVRQTPQGRQARRIFAADILLPVLRGEDLTQITKNDSRKSLQDTHLERIQNLIEDGIKELAQ